MFLRSSTELSVLSGGFGLRRAFHLAERDGSGIFIHVQLHIDESKPSAERYARPIPLASLWRPMRDFGLRPRIRLGGRYPML